MKPCPHCGEQLQLIEPAEAHQNKAFCTRYGKTINLE
nr:MAG TPA: RimK-related lysine biosynthesis protein, Probable-dependent amine/thiol ligase family Amino-group [Caudoviricetes sp.]